MRTPCWSAVATVSILVLLATADLAPKLQINFESENQSSLLQLDIYANEVQKAISRSLEDLPSAIPEDRRVFPSINLTQALHETARLYNLIIFNLPPSIQDGNCLNIHHNVATIYSLATSSTSQLNAILDVTSEVTTPSLRQGWLAEYIACLRSELIQSLLPSWGFSWKDLVDLLCFNLPDSTAWEVWYKQFSSLRNISSWASRFRAEDKAIAALAEKLQEMQLCHSKIGDTARQFLGHWAITFREINGSGCNGTHIQHAKKLCADLLLILGAPDATIKQTCLSL